jgi:hypothetical protein
MSRPYGMYIPPATRAGQGSLRADKPVPVSESNKRWAGVPVARYGLFHKGEQSWHFFEVRRPDAGKWQGWTFIGELTGDTVRKLPQQEADKIFAKITEDPARRMTDYGKQTTVCCRCHRTLTDPKSVAKGIGPDCAEMYNAENGLKF